ncbi:MAG: aminotransferase class IV [Bacteroidales bacterium]|nr:aminotransferase class IV [Bacteroidales bacterium]
MSLLVETIKVEIGALLNISFHNERMNRSLFEVFGLRKETDLEKIIKVPAFAGKGVYKCRIEYDDKTTKIEFLPYTISSVRSLKMIHDDNISYSHKYIERVNIQRLMDRRGDCDDILIIKNGMVTDSSYANVVFRDINGNWVTPSTYLLPGTRRASLLQRGLIKETIITYRDLKKHTEVKLINAMIGIDDTEGIPVGNII